MEDGISFPIKGFCDESDDDGMKNYFMD